jgi:hypothetical protein
MASVVQDRMTVFLSREDYVLLLGPDMIAAREVVGVVRTDRSRQLAIVSNCEYMVCPNI